MQEDKPPLFDAVHQLTGSLEMMAAVVNSVRLDATRPAAAAEQGWAVATDFAEALARNGTPFHQAHQIVGRLVLESVRQGKRPSQWTAAELTAFAPEFTPEMIDLMNPTAGMKTREIKGGTGLASVAAALEDAANRLQSWRL